MSQSLSMQELAGRPAYRPRSEHAELTEALIGIERRRALLRAAMGAALPGTRQHAEIAGAARLLDCERQMLIKRMALVRL